MPISYIYDVVKTWNILALKLKMNTKLNLSLPPLLTIRKENEREWFKIRYQKVPEAWILCKSYLNTIVGNILVLDHVEISILMFGFQI